MSRFLLVVVLLVLCVAGVGFYRGWFATETSTFDKKTNVNLSVDRNKIQDDINSLKKSTATTTEKKDPVLEPLPPRN